MFAGAGGLAEGFFRNDYDIVTHIEMNTYAAQTLETRVLYHALAAKGHLDIYYRYYNQNLAREDFLEECGDLGISDTGVINQKLSPETEDPIVQQIHERLAARNRDTVDVIIGGPPCQAYSLIGRARDHRKMQDDPRNYLYLHYLRFIKEFEPEIFVFENVPGLLSAKNGEIYSDFLKRIDKLGYATSSEPNILNASDFGVLQDRKRVIFIGWKKEHDFDYPSFESKKPPYAVRAVLGDLPRLKPGTGTDGPLKYGVGRPSGYLRKYGIRNNQKYIRHHMDRNNTDRVREIYRIAINMWSDNKERLKYDRLPDRLKTHVNQTSFLDRYKVVDGDGYSHSIVAHISKDGNYYIHPDISQVRSLTVREAARIQSFPDDYLFEGSRTAQYVQVGNAVPPLMAAGIAEEVAKLLAE